MRTLLQPRQILAAAYAQLGDLGAAREPRDDPLTQRPDFADTDAGLLAKWFQPEMVKHLMAGLRKAGLGDARSKGRPRKLVHRV